jgi:hypothetical protein
MKRYKPIRIISTEGNLKRKYIVTKYPEIPRGSSDIYVYVTKGDRYDLLAQTYYKDSSLWWIISKANSNLTSLDTIYPNPGDQIRIPSPSSITTIISSYELLNRTF